MDGKHNTSAWSIALNLITRMQVITQDINRCGLYFPLPMKQCFLNTREEIGYGESSTVLPPSTENTAHAGMKNRAMQTHSLTLACVKHVGIAGSGVDGFIHNKRADF